MEIEQLNTWEELIQRVEILKEKYRDTTENMLFRGHANENWKLETTLERYTNKVQLSAHEYSIILKSILPTVNTITNKFSFQSDDIELLNTENSQAGLYLVRPSKKMLEYMSFLRHYGFPTPILDWTESLYIALFFAFGDLSVNRDLDGNVAIYVYQDHPFGSRSGGTENGVIFSQGKYIESDPRHFIQQANYTICFIRNNDQIYYGSHENAFIKSYDEEEQGALYKFLIPKTETISVLKFLNSVNLNHQSLFQNIEGLMKTLAYKEINFE